MALGLDVLQAVSKTLHIATEIATLIQAYRNAPASIVSLSTCLADDISLFTQLKVVLQQTYLTDTGSVLDTDCDHIQKVLLHIDPILLETKTKIEKIVQGAPSNVSARLRWLRVGGDLEKAEKELFEWNRRLSLRLTLLSHNMKQDLAKTITQDSFSGFKAQTRMEELKQKFINMASLSTIDPDVELPRTAFPVDYPHTKRSIIQSSEPGTPHYILEIKHVRPEFSRSPESMAWIREELYKLSAILHAADPLSMHVLRSKGFTPLSLDPYNSFYGLIYQLPKGYSAEFAFSPTAVSPSSFSPGQPATLHTLLSASSKSGARLIAQHTLGARFELARQIATAVFYCHSIGWVHKAISAHNIIILSRALTTTTSGEKENKYFPSTLGTAFLAGFEYSRRDVDRTTGPPTDDDLADSWRYQIYQHPTRQVMQADVVDPEERYQKVHDLYSLGVVLLEIARWRPWEASAEVLKGKSAEGRREELVKMTERVSVVVGERYARVVRRCLDGGEDEEGGVGDEVKYVLGELEELSTAVR
jgi:hypothetical protein